MTKKCFEITNFQGESPSLNLMTTIRIRHPKGVLKIELSSIDITTLWLYESVASELSSIYPEAQSFWISSDPEDPEKSKLVPSSISILSPSHGQLFYLHLKLNSHEKLFNAKNLSNSDVDSKISSLDGKIKRKRDEKLCRHGLLGMCEHCQSIEVKFMIYIIYLFFLLKYLAL